MYFYHTHACGDSKCLKTGAAWDPPNCMEAGVMGFRCALWGGPGSGCGTGPWGLGCSPTCREVFWCAHNPRYFHLHVLIPAYKTKFSHWKFVEILILQIFTRFPKCHLTACASGIHSPLSPYCFLYIILPILISAERPSFCKWLVPVASFSKEASKWPSPSWWNCQVLAAVKVISNVSRTVAVNRKVPKACFKYLAKSPTHGVIS